MRKRLSKLRKKLLERGIYLRRERISSGRVWSSQYGFFEKDNRKYLIVSPELSLSEIESLIENEK